MAQYTVSPLLSGLYEPDPCGYPSKRSLARTSTGTLWTFYSTVATTRKMYAAKSTDGGATWSTEQISDGTGKCFYATVAVDTSDNVHVVYTQENAYSVENLKYIYYNGTSWTGRETLTDDGYSHQWCPALAIDSANKLHLTWYSNSTPGALYYKSKVSGSAWSSTTTLRSTTGDDVYMPSMFVDKNDYIHIVFSLKVSGGSYFHLQYLKSINGGSTWSSLTALTSDLSDNYWPSITCDCANGYPRVVWSKYTTTRHIYFISWNGSSWDTAVNLTSGYTYYQFQPCIATDGADDLTVVWAGWDNPNNCYQISKIQSEDNGATWGSISYTTSASWSNQNNPILINARWPISGSTMTNIPADGYAYVWAYNTEYLKYDSDSVNWAVTSATPSLTPSLTPSATPSLTPSLTPSATPAAGSATPSLTPSLTPSRTPSLTPSLTPSASATPSLTPSLTPSASATPSLTPSLTPSPSATPSLTPSATPSMASTDIEYQTFNESITKMRRFLRDPSGDVWESEDIRVLWNDAQIEIASKIGFIERINNMRYPPCYSYSYGWDWEINHITGDLYQHMNQWPQRNMIICYPWEPGYFLTSMSTADDGTRFMHPWESVYCTPSDVVRIPLHKKLHQLKFVAFDGDEIEPISEKELAMTDAWYKNHSGSPVNYYRPDEYENDMVLYPRPSAITWDDSTWSAASENDPFEESYDGIWTDTITVDGYLITIFSALPEEISSDTSTWDNDISWWPDYMIPVIEYATLERCFGADMDGFIPSLRDYWELRKKIGIEAIKSFKIARLTDRDYAMGAEQRKYKVAHPRLPSKYPRTRP